jgi:hypothetical protein
MKRNFKSSWEVTLYKHSKKTISRGGEIMGVAMEPASRASTPFPDSGGTESQNSSSSRAKRDRTLKGARKTVFELTSIA